MDKYERAQDRIAAGLWVVDAEAGQVYNNRGKAIGSPTWSGYVFLTLAPPVRGKSNQNAYAHRVIWESVHGRIEGDLQINHINGIKSDNRLDNLELVTASVNMQHAHRTGLAHGALPGEAHHGAKLTAATVQSIRERVAQGERQCAVAVDLGISRQQISRIVNRKGWRQTEAA